ncbi:unnamed protein product [Linum trigynum]|uniref:Uncharacterized protein n=1 Tax=Linum trigynum TaxID=586398 RepID=A0AAV2DZJ2_9ROSI
MIADHCSFIEPDSIFVISVAGNKLHPRDRHDTEQQPSSSPPNSVTVKPFRRCPVSIEPRRRQSKPVGGSIFVVLVAGASSGQETRHSSPRPLC